MWVQGLRQRQAFCVGVTMREDDQERTFEEGCSLAGVANASLLRI